MIDYIMNNFNIFSLSIHLKLSMTVIKVNCWTFKIKSEEIPVIFLDSLNIRNGKLIVSFEEYPEAGA